MRLSKEDKEKVEEIAEKYNLDPNQVKLIILSQYEFIRETITKIEIPDDSSREDFRNMKTNFNIPCIGKLYASYYLWKRIVNNKNKKK